MATIGTFRKTADGYCGTIKTIMLEIEAELRPVRKEHEKSPDFKISSAFGVFGAAWRRTSAADRDYLSCKIDDPAFAAPIYASLVLGDDDESYVLIWTR